MNQREVFEADLDKLNQALKPWVVTDEDDGSKWIDPSAPEALTRPYDLLRQYGYANGFF